MPPVSQSRLPDGVLMKAENPIYVILFSLSENGEGEEQKPDRREER